MKIVSKCPKCGELCVHKELRYEPTTFELQDDYDLFFLCEECDTEFWVRAKVDYDEEENELRRKGKDEGDEAYLKARDEKE